MSSEFEKDRKKLHHEIEKKFDVTFVDINVLKDGYVELIHPYSGQRKGIRIPKQIIKPDDRVLWMQEQAAAFVADVVKPRG